MLIEPKGNASVTIDGSADSPPSRRDVQGRHRASGGAESLASQAEDEVMSDRYSLLAAVTIPAGPAPVASPSLHAAATTERPRG